jgi:UDP-N-acetylglucosamine--N-acetylmuramyl-(pentapeptide) pyrophosphoryl-undecaprenol N-acetylglucosamine transferase
VLLSGGGTAGHIYPALAVAQTLAAERDEVRFVGTPDGLEARLVPEAGVDFVGLRAAGFDRSRPWTLLTSSAVVIASSLKARALMRSWRPDVVIGFGGYVSIPVALAARWAGIPLVIHEQNSVPGLANRICARWAAAAAVTYAESASRLAHPSVVTVTGNPVRPEVLMADRAAGRLALGLGHDDLVLLAFGGSRGARHLNTALLGLHDRLMAIPGLIVVHVTGPSELEACTQTLADAGGDSGRWRLMGYHADMGGAIAAADLVLARAGATSIAELSVLGAASLLVPYPYATDDHQTTNAAAMVDRGAAVLISDPELDTPRFGDELTRLLGDAGARATMAAASRGLGVSDAAQRVAVLARSAVRDRTAGRQDVS